MRQEKLDAIKAEYEPLIAEKNFKKMAADQELIDIEASYQQKIIEVNEYYDALEKLMELQALIDKGEPK